MTLINADCLMSRSTVYLIQNCQVESCILIGRASKGKKHKDEDKLHHAREVMIEQMRAREWNHKEVFDLIR